MKVKAKICIISIIAAALLLVLLFMLFSTGILKLNNPSREKYPVRGVDVSSYQGEIDWEVLSKQGISFAFIKATEGSTHKDSEFDENWENAQQTGLYIGAYHFFSYDSPGASQAENFISSVTPAGNMLPPVVDIEFYGDYGSAPAGREEVRSELNALLTALEKHYGAKPIIYATVRSYNMYIAGEYGDYPIWIRNVFTSPALSDGRDWTFWQFSDKGRLEGYVGDESYIDLNVFSGDSAALSNLCVRSDDIN